MARVVGLKRNGVIQRLSERLPHSPAITLLRPRIESILLGVSSSGRIQWVDNGFTSMTALTGAIMAMREIAVKFDEDERASIQDNADAAGMSFSEFVRRAALEKAEGMADIEAYNEALDGDGGTRYPMEEVMRMAAEAE